MNMYNLKFVNFDLLDLGKEYLISSFPIKSKKSLHKARRVKLIKATAKGYNFLDVESNKCILKRHLYPNKSNQIVLWKSIKITKIEIETGLEDEKFINLEQII